MIKIISPKNEIIEKSRRIQKARENMLVIQDWRECKISKCLKCLHDNGMDNSFIRSANFNIYAYLLGIGFITFNYLMSIKIGLPEEEKLRFLMVSIIFTFYILYRYTKQSENDSKSLVYQVTIFIFMAVTYIIY